ncbi:8556_t:CDS:2 [Funneliformis mosseae]|uniref:8556_t:CDS:1 n=1 Tax=Funneliformis mosseae TaxID=27381 RepID=A0A9N9FTZ5_FUNMO|nr:8556_t:CDS:2 [Funneliformis mosseae]
MLRPKKENNKNQQKQLTHSRPGTPEQQPKKKQNTLQNVEPESSMSTNNNNETPLMNVDPSPLDKGKGKEVLQKEPSRYFHKKDEIFYFLPN